MNEEYLKQLLNKALNEALCRKNKCRANSNDIAKWVDDFIEVNNTNYDGVLTNSACDRIGYADCTHWQNSSNGCRYCNQTFKKHP